MNVLDPAHKILSARPFNPPAGTVHDAVYFTQSDERLPKLCSVIVVLEPQLSALPAYCKLAYNVVAFDTFLAKKLAVTTLPDKCCTFLLSIF